MDKIMDHTIENTYKMKSLHEHILTIPDSYIGGIDNDNKEMWIYNEETKKMEKKI